VCATQKTYTIVRSSKATRQLKKLKGNRQVLQSIATTIRALANNPRPPGCEHLGGISYRVRDGDWRVVYTVHDDTLTVMIASVADRKDVYRH
jgi:mRNA interferase RelE/StbE